MVASTGDAGGPTLKLVFLGDPTTGKSSILNAVRSNHGKLQTGTDQVPLSVLEGFTTSVTLDGENEEHLCLLWDTIGSTEFETLRPLSYPKTDCFIICFAVNDRSSFNNLGTIWLPEIEANAPSVPYIFVCTKSELRTQLPPSDLLTPEEIEAFRSSPTGGASPVVETGDDLASINAMLKVAVKTALDHQKKERELKNTGSNSFCTIV